MKIYKPSVRTDPLFAVHCPPQKRIIHFNGFHYYLAFPDMLFLIRYVIFQESYYFSGIYCYFTNENISKFFFPCLPNISSDGLVCLGQQTPNPHPDSKMFVSNVIGFFWNTCFTWENLGAMYAYWDLAKLVPPMTNFFADWQKNTKENPQYLPGLFDTDDHFLSYDFQQNWEPLNV